MVVAEERITLSSQASVLVVTALVLMVRVFVVVVLLVAAADRVLAHQVIQTVLLMWQYVLTIVRVGVCKEMGLLLVRGLVINNNFRLKKRLIIVNIRINRTLHIGSVRKPNLPGGGKVSLYF
ncbi:hypothetical protein F4054_20250 [Candidatus Poribacteria bacterium]|nr:hypothetical protein [Candidatus Poribacteria bacterium]MYG06778.1 hypothetical protein [Candidatus Poribacteria bacterium]MYK24579.1 hypothetical protein [Candidatus Poribacteria bacterium]